MKKSCKCSIKEYYFDIIKVDCNKVNYNKSNLYSKERKSGKNEKTKE